MILCKNSKCKQRLNCHRYISMLQNAGTGKLQKFEVKEFEKDNCINYSPIKLEKIEKENSKTRVSSKTRTKVKTQLKIF